jgi:hypothetical protein
MFAPPSGAGIGGIGFYVSSGRSFPCRMHLHRLAYQVSPLTFPYFIAITATIPTNTITISQSGMNIFTFASFMESPR